MKKKCFTCRWYQGNLEVGDCIIRLHQNLEKEDYETAADAVCDLYEEAEFDFVRWLNKRFSWEDPHMPHIFPTEEGGIGLVDDHGHCSVVGKSLKEIADLWDKENPYFTDDEEE